MSGRDVLSFLRSSGTVKMMREFDPQITEWALSRRPRAPRGAPRVRRGSGQVRLRPTKFTSNKLIAF